MQVTQDRAKGIVFCYGNWCCCSQSGESTLQRRSKGRSMQRCPSTLLNLGLNFTSPHNLAGCFSSSAGGSQMFSGHSRHCLSFFNICNSQPRAHFLHAPNIREEAGWAEAAQHIAPVTMTTLCPPHHHRHTHTAAWPPATTPKKPGHVRQIARLSVFVAFAVVVLLDQGRSDSLLAAPGLSKPPMGPLPGPCTSAAWLQPLHLTKATLRNCLLAYAPVVC